MKICFVSESLNNPNWSACNFFSHGLLAACNQCGHELYASKHSGNIPSNMDWYIDVDSARPMILDRRKYSPTCSFIIDLFDTACDQNWRYESANTADKIIVTNNCSRVLIEERFNKPSSLITFGLNHIIWKPIDTEKIHDSVFIGNISRPASEKRGRFFGYLREAGYDIFHSHNQLYMADNAAAQNSGKIGLEIPNDGYDTFGMRALEIIGCGLPLLIVKDSIIDRILPQGLVTYYEPHKESLITKYTEVMDNLKEKTEAAAALREYFLKSFTYEKIGHRIIKILEGTYNESEMFCS